MARMKAAALILGVLLCGGLGLLAALVWQPDRGVSEATVLRVRNGVTEHGRVVAITTSGSLKRVIVWETRGGIETETVRGALRVESKGVSHASEPPVARHVATTLTVTLPPETITLPGETVIHTVTETTPPDTVTETVGTTTDVETGIETVPESPSP